LTAKTMILRALSGEVRVKGPAGEMFSKPKEFIDMLRSYHGRYDLKKVFTDGNDVCLLYDLKTSTATVFMCSWYQVSHDKIGSIQTVFDPRPFSPPPDKKSA
jgi:hypothetical protein